MTVLLKGDSGPQGRGPADPSSIQQVIISHLTTAFSLDALRPRQGHRVGCFCSRSSQFLLAMPHNRAEDANIQMKNRTSQVGWTVPRASGRVSVDQRRLGSETKQSRNTTVRIRITAGGRVRCASRRTFFQLDSSGCSRLVSPQSKE